MTLTLTPPLYSTLELQASDLEVMESTETRVQDSSRYPRYDPTTEPIFPPELMLMKPRPLHVASGTAAWYRPTSLTAMLGLKKRFPTARIITGNTEVCCVPKPVSAAAKTLTPELPAQPRARPPTRASAPRADVLAKRPIKVRP